MFEIVVGVLIALIVFSVIRNLWEVLLVLSLGTIACLCFVIIVLALTSH